MPAGSHESDPRCFMPETLIQTPNNSYVPVTSLEVGSRVVAASGTILVVLRAVLHAEQSLDLFELHTGNATLIVTGSHRVMVQGGKGPTSKLAAALQPPAKVICNNGMACELHSVQKYVGWTKVVELLLNPDEAVSTFLPPAHMILTKGAAHQARRTRRGGMRRRRTKPRSLADSGDTYQE